MSKKVVQTGPIGIIYAGGTFGSYGKPLASLPAETFLPILAKVLDEHVASYPHQALQTLAWQILPNTVIKDSSQLTPADFAEFYSLILTAMQSGMRQFVLLTGTDTLSYLASFLAEAFAGSSACIIVTGAMQPLLDSAMITEYVLNPHSDATQNLFDAYKLARHGEAGVRVCFGSEHWPAQTVQKIHSQDMMAFVGHHRAGYPANSYSHKLSSTQQAHWLADKLEQLPATITALTQAKIVTIYLTPMSTAWLAEQLHSLLSMQPDAIILMGYGAGNVPASDAIRQQLTQAKAQGCLVAITTQSPYGGVSTDYQAGAWLAKCDVLPTGRLTVPAIFARLLWLTANHDTPARRRQRWTHVLKDTQTVA